MKAIKSDSDSDMLNEQKKSSGFSGKNKGVTPSVAAPGVIHPSDATTKHVKYGKGNPEIVPCTFYKMSV